ncbi:hypothetical protein C8R47DRAFT_221459 [Mycena vitilis]|nr:hypothetical protein C8R47DRAFT_221459 [Mycena vitilis]
MAIKTISRAQQLSKMSFKYRQAFWMFVCSHALQSAFLGRPRLTRDDDYDADYPVEVRSGRRILGASRPGQKIPTARRRTLCLLFHRGIDQVDRNFGNCSKNNRTPHSIVQARLMYISKWAFSIPLNVHNGALDGARPVAELDSALNQWLDSIPDHLRWDPNRQQEPFATQSACLYTGYYHVQIQIHRSFIPSPLNDAPLSSFTSLQPTPSIRVCRCDWQTASEAYSLLELIQNC